MSQLAPGKICTRTDTPMHKRIPFVTNDGYSCASRAVGDLTQAGATEVG